MAPGRPSKFTAERKARILEAFQIGASVATAAAVGGVSDGALRGWLARGKEPGAPASYREFVEEVEKARAHPKTRALSIVYNAMAERPELAWKFLERREHGFAPPQPNALPAQTGPVVINLSFANPNRAVDVPKIVSNETTPALEGEVIDVPEARDSL